MRSGHQEIAMEKWGDMICPWLTGLLLLIFLHTTSIPSYVCSYSCSSAPWRVEDEAMNPPPPYYTIPWHSIPNHGSSSSSSVGGWGGDIDRSN
ncbi:hypothetical protein P167DRAFT_98153 [Morchella conica CCBAS932]|uniref:Uncharacterized protein n=1 Tax=Morchella conica CCBAS932 TaxID=1392247 RepID=A0A3N4KT76_9PEZI|nr:hypothetical protein P167DRAFT_98153 [Morchella conica CCBAS932]